MADPDPAGHGRATVTVMRDGDHWNVVGDIDFDNHDTFADALWVAAVEDRLVLDMSCVNFIDSLGLSELIRLHRQGHAVTIRNPSDCVRRLIELTMATAVLDVEQTSVPRLPQEMAMSTDIEELKGRSRLAASMVVTLLLRKEYQAVRNITEGRDYSAEELARLLDEMGTPPQAAPDTFDDLEVEVLSATEPKRFALVVRCAADATDPDRILELSMRMTENYPRTVDVELTRVHVE